MECGKEAVMKKGISIWSFGGSTPEEAFAAAKQYGFDGVEDDPCGEDW